MLAGTEDGWMFGLQSADTHLLARNTRALCELDGCTDARPYLR